MIEKLNPNDWDMLKAIDKINEIIDHLPQEKGKSIMLESFCNCPICQGGVRRCEKQPTEEVEITCNEASFCIYKFQNGSLCGCKFKDWCAYQTPQIDRKPTKEVPDIRQKLSDILEELLKYNNCALQTYLRKNSINEAIQEISALYRKEMGK